MRRFEKREYQLPPLEDCSSYALLEQERKAMGISILERISLRLLEQLSSQKELIDRLNKEGVAITNSTIEDYNLFLQTYREVRSLKSQAYQEF